MHDDTGRLHLVVVSGKRTICAIFPDLSGGAVGVVPTVMLSLVCILHVVFGD